MKKTKPLLVASAGAATIVFACGKSKPMRIGPTPPLPTPAPEEIVYTATAVPTATPIAIDERAERARSGGEGGRTADRAIEVPTPELPIRIGPPTTPEPIPMQQGGRLDVASNHTAWIFIDGRQVDVAPVKGLYVDGGPHVIRVVETKTGAAIEFRIDMPSHGYLRRKVVFPPVPEPAPTKIPIRIGAKRE